VDLRSLSRRWSWVPPGPFGARRRNSRRS
jgi:hypothetical protein